MWPGLSQPLGDWKRSHGAEPGRHVLPIGPAVYQRAVKQSAPPKMHCGSPDSNKTASRHLTLWQAGIAALLADTCSNHLGEEARKGPRWFGWDRRGGSPTARPEGVSVAGAEVGRYRRRAWRRHPSRSARLFVCLTRRIPGIPALGAAKSRHSAGPFQPSACLSERLLREGGDRRLLRVTLRVSAAGSRNNLGSRSHTSSLRR
ncbi:hypothetical protein AAFF_G00368900 [Aldrovandia affinis]|uniref:Uncharacterized protein n=1 Tax=Aldrovandia affinis TaxID=143900 RepID=A0AAD7WMD6_9TELE|nr:hypothetical protein AAFF_G00368900 [Aldrovandia affinis]